MTPQIEDIYRKCLQSVAPAENEKMLKRGQGYIAPYKAGSRGPVTSPQQGRKNAQKCRDLRATGMKLKDIAEETGFTLNTVKQYCSKIWDDRV